LLGPGNGLCLDLGCGTGHYFGTIRASARTVVGVDSSADQLRVARSRSGDWVTVDTDGPDALELVARVVELAAQAHQPPAGTIPKPPSSGPDLARRRRFH
jgi:SAM-dependent methyltransferase